jgi:hypothetical protein
MSTHTKHPFVAKYRSLTHGIFNDELGLKKLGANVFDLILPESHALSSILIPNEYIEGIVFGRYIHTGAEESRGRGALVVTNGRIMLIDKKPLFLKCEELGKEVISGVMYTRIGLSGIVTLSTRMGNIKVRTFNHACARSFVSAIEAKLFNHPEFASSADKGI